MPSASVDFVNQSFQIVMSNISTNFKTACENTCLNKAKFVQVCSCSFCSIGSSWCFLTRMWWLLVYGFKFLVTGSKYLEYISSLMIMHSNNINWTQSSLNEEIENAHIKYNTRHNRQNVHVQGWTIILGFLLKTSIKKTKEKYKRNVYSAEFGGIP